MIKYVKLLCGLKQYKWPEFNSIDSTGCRTRAEFPICARADEQHAFSPSVKPLKSGGSSMLAWEGWLSLCPGLSSASWAGSSSPGAGEAVGQPGLGARAGHEALGL